MDKVIYFILFILGLVAALATVVLIGWAIWTVKGATLAGKLGGTAGGTAILAIALFLWADSRKPKF